MTARHAEWLLVQPPAMCLLHGDFHILDVECSDTLASWWFNHLDLGPHTVMREAYMLEVEAKMLAEVLG